MGNLVLNGATSGATTLTPTDAVTITATFPSLGGTVMVSGNMPAFSAYNNANQTITTGTYTKVTCNTKEFDTNSNYDNATNYRFTPTVAGYYQINGQISIFAGSGFTRGIIVFYKNGSQFKFGNDITTGNVNGGRYIASSLIYCNGSTDYIEMYCYIVGSGTLILSTNGAADNFFQASMVRAA